MDKRRRQYLKKIQEKFNYNFVNLNYLDEAVDRTTLSDSYEFFGDIALYGAASEYMIIKYTKPLDEFIEDKDGNVECKDGEGGIETLTVNKLNELKSKLTNNQTFALIVRKLDLVNDMPLSAEDEINGLRDNNHRLADFYERIIGAISIDLKYNDPYHNLTRISDIYSSHINLVANDIDLTEYASDDLGASDFTREVILKRSDIFGNFDNEITQLKLLVDKKKLPNITYDFSLKRDKNNVITHYCTAVFSPNATIDLKSQVNCDVGGGYEDIHKWPTKLFNSIGKGKSKNEAKTIATHAIFNKLKARYGVQFLMTGLPYEIGESVKDSQIKIRLEYAEQAKLNKNINVSDELLEEFIKYNIQ